MKTLKESLLDKDFDVNVVTDASKELIKILDSYEWFTIGDRALTTKNKGIYVIGDLEDFFEKHNSNKDGVGLVYFHKDGRTYNLQIRDLNRQHPMLASFFTFSSHPRAQFNLRDEPAAYLHPKHIKWIISDKSILFWLRNFFEDKMKKAKRYEDY